MQKWYVICKEEEFGRWRKFNISQIIKEYEETKRA